MGKKSSNKVKFHKFKGNSLILRVNNEKKVATDPQTGDPLIIRFVDLNNSHSGKGTFEAPFNNLSADLLKNNSKDFFYVFPKGGSPLRYQDEKYIMNSTAKHRVKTAIGEVKIPVYSKKHHHHHSSSSSSSSTHESDRDLLEEIEKTTSKTEKIVKHIDKVTESTNSTVLTINAVTMATNSTVNNINTNVEQLVANSCTVIDSIPPGGYFITVPGCYLFGAELTYDEPCPAPHAITISTPDVIIDGGGHSLTIGVDVHAGILWNGVDNIVLRNMTVQASSLSLNDANRAIECVDSNNALFENVRTSLTYTGIQLSGCYDFRFIRIVQDNHRSGQTPIPGGHTESTALVVGPSPTGDVSSNSAQLIFYQCQWRDNMQVQGDDPTNFTGNDGIYLTYSFDVDYPTGDGATFIECQFLDTNVAFGGWKNVLFRDCTMRQLTRQFLPQIECDFTNENISLLNCHLTASDPIYCTDLVAAYSVNGIVIQNCVIDFPASGQNADPTVAWPQWNSSAIRISAASQEVPPSEEVP